MERMKVKVLVLLCVCVLWAGNGFAQKGSKGKQSSKSEASKEDVQVSYQADPAGHGNSDHKCLTSIYQVILNTGDMNWVDGPSFLPQGVKMAVLEGDIMKDGPFTIRLRLPTGYQLLPHTHVNPEHITVLSGNYKMAMGDKYDESMLKTLKVGGIAVMPANTMHYETATEETVLQIHGHGPWQLSFGGDATGGTGAGTIPLGTNSRTAR